MTGAAPTKSWFLEVGVGVACALATFLLLKINSSAPRERKAVEVLEAQVRTLSSPRRLIGDAGDRSAADALCTTSLARAIGELERRLPERARTLGVRMAEIRFLGPAVETNGAVAPATLTLEGAADAVNQAMLRSNDIAPSLFFDQVQLTPAAQGEWRVVAEGRLVCARL